MPATGYALQDAVSFAGSTYLATAAQTGLEPDLYPAAWAVLAQAGSAGPTGAQGTAATVAVGTVTTLPAGSAATVSNAGTAQAAVLNFAIPQGAPGASGGSAGAGSGGFAAFFHAVSYAATYYAVNSPNAYTSETGTSATTGVLAWVPLGCTATQLSVYSQQGNTITVTLRAGLPGSMAPTALTCSAATNSSCVATGPVTLAAGQFVDYEIDGASGTAAGVWTALQCQ
jgi:hypothetical protein